MKRSSTQTKNNWYNGTTFSNITRVLAMMFLSFLIYSEVDAQGCANCTSSDIKVSGISLKYDKTLCSDSNAVIEGASIEVNLNVTSTERYGFYVYYELWIDGKPASPLYYKKCFPLTLTKGDYKVPLIDLPPFVAYQTVEIRNVMTAWSQNAPVNGVYFCDNLDGYACDLTAPKCKFYAFAFPAQISMKPSFWGVSNNQPVCTGGTATFNIGGTPNSTAFYTLNGVQGSTTLDASGYASVSNTNSTSNVSLTVDSLKGATCVIPVGITYIANVNYINTAGSISGDQTICKGGDPAAFTSGASASGNGQLEYQWQFKTATSDWTNIDSAKEMVYDAPPPVSEQTVYRRLAVAVGCTQVPSNEVTVNVIQSDPGTVTGDQVICTGSVPAAFTSVAPASGGTPIVYQWQRSTDGGKTWSNIRNATSENFTERSQITRNTLYRRQATLTVNSILCTIYSNIVSVSINSVNNAGSISTSQIICAQGDAAAISSGTTTVDAIGSVIYQWQYSADNGTTWNTIADASTESYDPPAGSISLPTLFRRGAAVELNGLACDNTFSNTVAVDITTLSDAGTVSSDQVICKDATPAMITSTTEASALNGTTSYMWQTSTDGSNWSNIDTAIASSIEPSALSQTTLYRRIANALNNGTVCESNFSNAITVTVNNVENAGSVSSDQLICKSDIPVAFGSVAAAAGTGTISYKWESSVDGGNTWTSIDGATADTYASPVLEQSTIFRRISSVDANGTACNSLISNSVSVIHGSVLDAGVINGANQICQGTNPASFSASDAQANVADHLTYQWQKSTDDGANWLDIPGATKAIFDESRPVWIPTLYRRVAKFTLNNGSTCDELASNSVLVTVKECEKCKLLNEYTKGYPNPYKNNFTLKFSSCTSGTAIIELFDFKGGKMQEIKVPNVVAGAEVKYNIYLPQSLTGVIYKISIGEYSTTGRMISAQ